MFRYFSYETKQPISTNCQHLLSHFYLELLNIYAVAFFGSRSIVNLAVRCKTASELLQWKENLMFTLVYCSYRLISVVDLDPYQFGSSSLLVRSGSLKELWCDFQPPSQIGEF
jgi:hypothetical protein